MPILSSIGAMSIGTTGNNDISIYLSTTSFLFNTSGIGIMSRFITVSGGVSPYTYSFSPSLPGGVTFDATSGTFTGTPLGATPTTAYDITVTDSNFSTKTVTINITTEIFVPKPITVLVTQIPAITVWSTVNSLVASATGGWPGSLTFSATGLPPGLSLTTGGYLIGTLTPPDDFLGAVTSGVTIKIIATDKTGATGSSFLTLRILATNIIGYPLYPTVNTSGFATIPTDITVPCGVSTSVAMFDTTKTPTGGIPSYNYFIDTGSSYGFTSVSSSGVTTGVPNPPLTKSVAGYQGSVLHTVSLRDQRGASTPSNSTTKSSVRLHFVNRSGVAETSIKIDKMPGGIAATNTKPAGSTTIQVDVTLYTTMPSSNSIQYDIYFSYNLSTWKPRGYTPAGNTISMTPVKIGSAIINSVGSQHTGFVTISGSITIPELVQPESVFSAYVSPTVRTVSYGVSNVSVKATYSTGSSFTLGSSIQ